MCSQGDLFDEMRRRTELMKESEAVSLVILPVLNALAYMHSKVCKSCIHPGNKPHQYPRVSVFPQRISAFSLLFSEPCLMRTAPILSRWSSAPSGRHTQGFEAREHSLHARHAAQDWGLWAVCQPKDRATCYSRWDAGIHAARGPEESRQKSNRRQQGQAGNGV